VKLQLRIGSPCRKNASTNSLRLPAIASGFTSIRSARRESPYGAPVAHGFLTLSLASQFLREAIQLPAAVRQTINYGLNRVRFPAPVRAGEKIRARIRLSSCRELPDSLEAVYEITMEAEGATKPCCVAEWILRYYA
jgi:acyl dehydratase